MIAKDRPSEERNVPLIRIALNGIYPAKCALCGLIGNPPICSICGEEFEPHGQIEELPSIDFAFALYRYTGRAAQAVKRLKFERTTSLAAPMAAQLADTIAMEFPDFDLAVPVPIHWSRRCHRGFNQAEMLAEGLDPSVLSIRTLRRRLATRPQAGLSPQERQTNLIGAFQVHGDVAGARVLLIDDVVTSGCTARECADCLRNAGAASVLLATFATGGP